MNNAVCYANNILHLKSMQNAYLFSWSPKKWPVAEMEREIAELKAGTRTAIAWGCSSYKAIRPGDRAFFITTGNELPRGILGSGYITDRPPFYVKHWDGSDRYRWMIEIAPDIILLPEKGNEDSVLSLEVLNMGRFTRQNWAPQGAGISIRPELVEELEALWADYLGERGLSVQDWIANR